MSWLQKLMFRAQGIKVDDDNYREVAVIRYEDIYIQVLKGDSGYNVAWSSEMPPTTPVRDMLVATSPTKPVPGRGV